MGIIIFNNVSSKDYHIQVEHPPEYVFPKRDYIIQHVPGRNGDIVLDTGSYQNAKRTYQIAVGSFEENYTTMVNKISEWLHSASGYARLEDSYEPEYYRLAMYEDEGTIENIFGQAGRTTISFNCKPQRFLKSGDILATFNKGGTLSNPTNFTSLPVITVKGNGNGVFRIGDFTVIISEINSEIVIDSEIQDCYSGSNNRNSYVKLNNGFPKIIAGENEISFSGGITSMEVIPKWWTL